MNATDTAQSRDLADARALVAQRWLDLQSVTGRMERFIDMDRYREACGFGFDGWTQRALSQELKLAKKAYEDARDALLALVGVEVLS